MKSTFLCVLLIFFYNHLCAQSKLEILYDDADKTLEQFDDSNYIKTQNADLRSRKILLTITDSISYECFYDPRSLKKNNPLGSKFATHARYTDISRNLVINSVKPFGRQNCMIRDTVEVLQWQFDNATKNILGYHCKKAFLINKNNSLIEVWYAPALSSMMGPFGLNGLKGAILETYNHAHGTSHVAIRISTDSRDIIEPAKGRFITREQFKNIMSRGR